MSKTFRPNLDLPHFLEGWNRRWRATLSTTAIVFRGFTVALEVQHCLVPLILDLLAVCSDGKALAAGIKDYHVLVLGICPLVDVEAGLQVQDFFGHR